MNYGMHCHDICPKADIDTVLDAGKENGIGQIPLAFGKSIAGYDFSAGHYSPGFAHMIGRQLRERDIHVAVLGCPGQNMRNRTLRCCLRIPIRSDITAMWRICKKYMRKSSAAIRFMVY